VSGPPPPRDLAGRRPSIARLRTGTIIHRFYSSKHDPIFFDRGLAGRLNAPDGTYGVLYAAQKPAGAFAETFLRNPGSPQLPLDLLNQKAYVRLKVSGMLTLLQLAGPGLARVGATAEITHSGLPYDVPQSWSAAIHALAQNFDGIAYHARHDDQEVCYALFDRAADRVTEESRTVDLDDNWFWKIAGTYNVGLAPG
jgi:hypothetical protein